MKTGEEALALRRADGGEVARRQKVKLIKGDLGRVRTVDPAPGRGDLVARHQSSARSPVWSTSARASIERIHRQHVLMDRRNGLVARRELARLRALRGPGPPPTSSCTTSAPARPIRSAVPTSMTGRRASTPKVGTWLFLSARVFDPVPDLHFHDYGFPRAALPMLIPLKADARSPFSVIARDPRPPGSAGATGATAPALPAAAGSTRLPSCPANGEPTNRHDRNRPRPASPIGSRPFRSRRPPTPGSRPRGVGPTFNHSRSSESSEPRSRMGRWDVSRAGTSPPTRSRSLRTGSPGSPSRGMARCWRFAPSPPLRVVPVGWKDDKNPNDKPGRETGFVDLARIRVEVNPAAEWRQMFDEAWRLQRDHYWWEDMGGVDWIGIRERYLELVDRVASRAEFSDLLWEMQGELGTSHAYELGGDYRPPPVWTQGHLGADVEWNRGAWRVIGHSLRRCLGPAGRVTAGGAGHRRGGRRSHRGGRRPGDQRGRVTSGPTGRAGRSGRHS